MNDTIATLKKNERGVCVTLVVSGKPKSFDDKEKTLVKLRKSIAGAGKIIAAGYGEETAKVLVDQLNKQLNNLDFSNATESLVMYTSNGFGGTVWLPFFEKERVTVLSKFDIQPLIDALALKRTYWVLALSKNKTRLFHAENDRLNEVVDGNFPLAYEEQFDYDKQHYSLSHKHGTYAPGDSKVAIVRFHAFIRHIDHLLAKHFKNDIQPLVLLGVTHNLSDFVNTSPFANRVVNTVKGNFDHHSTGQIAKKVWSASEGKLYGNADQSVNRQLNKKQSV